MKSEMKPKKICAKIGISLLVLFLVWLFGVRIGIILINRFYPEGLQNISLLLALNDVALYLLGLPVFLLLLSKIPDGADPERQKLKVGPLRLLLLFVFCLGAAYIFAIINSFLVNIIESAVPGFNAAENLSVILNEDNILLRLLFIVLIPAVGEEFIFRRCLHKKLRGASDISYIAISGIAFGFFHASYSQVLFAVAIGMALAWVYTQTRKLFYCSAIHFMINFLSSIVLPFILKNVDIDTEELLDIINNPEAADAGAMEAIGKETILTTIAGLVIIGVMVGAVIIFAVNFRYIIVSLRPPAEPGWPYKPPKKHYLSRAPIVYSRPQNPYSSSKNGEDWKMPAPEDEIVQKKSPFPDYTKAIETYAKHQEVALQEKEYNYLSGIPYDGPKDETLENLPLKGWFKTCFLNYGMIAYLLAICAYMVYQVVIVMLT